MTFPTFDDDRLTYSPNYIPNLSIPANYPIKPPPTNPLHQPTEILSIPTTIT